MKIRAVLFTLLLIFCFLSISTNQYKFQISSNEEKNILKKFSDPISILIIYLTILLRIFPLILLKKISNTITDSKATLRRILFYDHRLSISNKIVCASCHQ